MNHDAAAAEFRRLADQSEGVATARLDEIWAALPKVRAEEILGAWKGAVFATGHPVGKLLGSTGWYGKTFTSLTHAQPLICVDNNGERYSDIERGKGEASLWNVEFRGEVTATMVYDGQPIFDHFKQVDESTLMGIMNGKPDLVLYRGAHLYFILERE